VGPYFFEGTVTGVENFNMLKYLSCMPFISCMEMRKFAVNKTVHSHITIITSGPVLMTGFSDWWVG
jgi:hypothetical protein